jgi:hypothetical protein
MIGGKGAKGPRPYPLPAPLPQSLRKAGEGGACGSSFPRPDLVGEVCRGGTSARPLIFIKN